MENRAYSLLTIKSIDEDARIITGIATTPATDRVGDIVEPKGAKFSLPIPLLWQHRSDSPIGHVIEATVTDAGIAIVAQIAKTDNPGDLKNLLDKAWEAIKLKLVRGLSIGFKALEWTDIDGTWGQRFVSWEWYELSTVTIPANADASIHTVKHLDTILRAATGSQSRPGASGKSVKLLPPKPKDPNVKTVAEQITDFEATRAAKAARLTEIQNKAATEGRTKDAAEKEEFDTLRDELSSIDAELKDLRDLEKMQLDAAKAVDTTTTQKAASDARSPQIRVEREEKLEKGIEFARYAMCLAAAKGNMPQALELAKTHYPKAQRILDVMKMALGAGTDVEKLLERHMMMQKANVPAGTTSDATWAGPLLAYNTFAGDFVEFLRAKTIIGQFGQNGIPDLRRIPFNVHIKGQTSGGTGYWVGQGKPKPVTKFDFNDTYHGWHKVAAMAVLTEDLIRFSDPSAERLVRDALASCLIERLDTDFIDPSFAGSANVSPASVTNGVSATASSGVDGDAVRADIQELWEAPMAAHLPLTDAVYITTPAIALGLSLMMNALGQREFPDMTMMGGRLLGVPVLVSNYVPTGLFVLAFASEIYLSDDGQVTVDASREASLQMLSDPTNDSATPTPTTLVSMFQTDSIALRAHRFTTWSKRRTTAVSVLEDVAWGGAELS